MNEDPERDGLAGERTLLAWTRTGLALAAVGAVTLRMPERVQRAGWAVGASLIVLGAVVWAVGYRGAAAQRELRIGSRRREILALCAVASAAGTAALVLGLAIGG